MPGRRLSIRHWSLLCVAAAVVGVAAMQRFSRHEPAEGGEKSGTTPAQALRSEIDSEASRLAEQAFVMHQTLSVYLLGTADVQLELMLDEAQKQKVADIIDAGLGEFYKLWDSASEKSAKSGSPEFAIARKTEAQLRVLLSAEQYERLNKMVRCIDVGPVGFVRTGPLVFLTPEVDQALELSATQRAAIVQIALKTDADIAEVPGSTLRLGRVSEIVSKGRQDAEAALTERQRTKWSALLGTSTDVPER